MINGIPKKIIAKSTAPCLVELKGYTPVDGWAATLALRGVTKANVDGVVTGSCWEFTLPELSKGHYWWQVIVQRDGEQQVPLSGELEVLPNLLDENENFDGRSEAKKALDAVNAVLYKKASRDQLSYQINGRQLQRYSISDLMTLRSFLANKVRREKGKNGFKTMRVRM